MAARMRPRDLDECLGQEHLLARGHALGDAIRRGDVGSTILWGPPGSGKTTLARLMAQYTDRAFVAFSAVTEGVPRVREIIREAEGRRAMGQGTILFCDEIHRFNKGQQDAFLPHVESGVITLIGATTENPSFELNGALLSRCRVYVLEPLAQEDLASVARRALGDDDRGLGALGLEMDGSGFGLGTRSQRFAMIVEDGAVEIPAAVQEAIDAKVPAAPKRPNRRIRPPRSHLWPLRVFASTLMFLKT